MNRFQINQQAVKRTSTLKSQKLKKLDGLYWIRQHFDIFTNTNCENIFIVCKVFSLMWFNYLILNQSFEPTGYTFNIFEKFTHKCMKEIVQYYCLSVLYRTWTWLKLNYRLNYESNYSASVAWFYGWRSRHVWC